MFIAHRIALAFTVLLAANAIAAMQEWRGRPLTDYIDHLSEQGMPIIYSDELVHSGLTIISEPVDESSEALREALLPHGMTLSLGPGKNWLIITDPQAEASATIHVIDADTNTSIVGAAVIIDDVVAGATDTTGRFRFQGPSRRTHELTVVADDYASPSAVRFMTAFESSTDLRVLLEPLPQLLPEIIVSSSVYNIRYQQPGSYTFLDRDFVSELPDIGEEVLSGIERLPGVANGGVSTRSHVRGGSNNEQLIVLDGLRLYEPYHMKDFHAISTTISQGATEGINFYTAGYQARYGDRMSGVIDIELRDRPVKTETELGISLFNISALSTGRFASGQKGDWLVSARRSNLDLLSRAVQSKYGSPRFEDALLHAGWQWTDRTYVAANFLYSKDRIEISQSDDSESATAEYRNNVGWLKVNTDWSENVASTTILSATDISNTRIGQTSIPYVVFGDVEDSRDFSTFGVKQDWNFALGQRWWLRTGFDIKVLDAEYEYDSTLLIDEPFDQIFDNTSFLQRSIRTQPEGEQYAAYVEARWQARDNLVIDLGFRWDRQTYSSTDSNEQRSPRLNVLYEIGERTEFRFGLGRFYQAQEINELQVDAGLTEFFRPQYADHVVASIVHQFPEALDLRVEFYQKNYQSLMPRIENAFDSLVLIPELQIDRARVDADEAFVYGAEITLSQANEKKALQWWAGYVWSSTEDSVSGVNVRRSWDQKHSIKAGINTQVGRWNFSAAGAWHSGWPATHLLLSPVQNPDGSTELIATTTPRNSLNYDAFHTLDMRVSRKYRLPDSELTAFVEISNISNRQNPCCNEYRVQIGSDGSKTLQVNQNYWLPLVPSIGVVWKF